MRPDGRKRNKMCLFQIIDWDNRTERGLKTLPEPQGGSAVSGVLFSGR